MVNPAWGGTLPIEVTQVSSNPSTLDPSFQPGRFASIETTLRPNELPRSFDSLGGLGEMVGRVIVLADPSFQITRLAAIISTRALAP